MNERPRLLILCFDDIHVDPRVMKQVNLFVDTYDVTTCSPGPQPHPDVQHIELVAEPPVTKGRIGNLIDDIARSREWFGRTYRDLPWVRAARTALRGTSFDVAIANDATTVKVASDLIGPERVHADLHEFFPGLPQPDDRLGERQTRYWTWLIEAHSGKVASATSVGDEIARRYAGHGVVAGTVWNAAPGRDLPVRPTPTPIRLVHSGNPFRDRGLAEMMTAVARSTNDLTLDLYLTKRNPADRELIVELAAELGPRITVHDPVPQANLIDTLNQYDVGIYVLPPASENSSLALPNKFFDFVQARLAVIVGPSVEMRRLVDEHRLGLVTRDFSTDAIVEVLDALTPMQVDTLKRATDLAAPKMTAESQNDVWASAVAAIVSAHGRKR